MNKLKKFWNTFRKIWVFVGACVLIIFFMWMFIAYKASNEAKDALTSDDQIHVYESDHYWSFTLSQNTVSKPVGLLFFPGALVDPAAYAPLVREIASQGYPSILLKVPMRGMMGRAESGETINRALAAMRSVPDVTQWVIAGHSRGGSAASHFIHENGLDDPNIGGLILIGTTHPRRVKLSHLTIPVTKILGSKDCIAPVEWSNQEMHNLPESTKVVIIKGGNHSQFGHYGFQPGDCFATISREMQQEQTIKAIVETLELIR